MEARIVLHVHNSVTVSIDVHLHVYTCSLLANNGSVNSEYSTYCLCSSALAEAHDSNADKSMTSTAVDVHLCSTSGTVLVT